MRTKMQKYFLLPMFIYGSAKQHDDKREDDEQTLTELSSAHRRSQAKCQLVQTSYIKRIKLFLFGHIIKILLTELGQSVWENLDLGRWYRPHCVRSVLATSVKILPYRPPARLIRTKYKSRSMLRGQKKNDASVNLINVNKTFLHFRNIMLSPCEFIIEAP